MKKQIIEGRESLETVDSIKSKENREMITFIQLVMGIDLKIIEIKALIHI